MQALLSSFYDWGGAAPDRLCFHQPPPSQWWTWGTDFKLLDPKYRLCLPVPTAQVRDSSETLVVKTFGNPGVGFAWSAGPPKAMPMGAGA